MGTPPISYCRCIRGREVGSEWILFTAIFCGKAFCHREKLINFANEKMLYNIIIQHKTADGMSAGLKNKRKNI